MALEATLLVSVGCHPVSGRARPAEGEARALALALGSGAERVRAIHAGPAERAAPVVRDFVGMGASEGAILDLPPGVDPLGSLAGALAGEAGDVVLAGVAAEAGEGSGMVPYCLARSLDRPLVANLVAIEGSEPDGTLVQQALPGGRRRRLLVAGPFVATVGPAGPAPRLSAFARARRAAIAATSAGGDPDPLASLPSRPAVPRMRRPPAAIPGADAASRLDAILNRGRSLAGSERTVLADVSSEEAARIILAFLRREGLLAGDPNPAATPRPHP